MEISKAEKLSSKHHCNAVQAPKMQQASSESSRLACRNDDEGKAHYEYHEPLAQATSGQLSHTHHHPLSNHYHHQHPHPHEQHPQDSSNEDDKFVALNACRRQEMKPLQISIIRPTTLLTTTNSSLKSSSRPKFVKQLFRNLFNLLVINAILSNLEQLNYIIVSMQDKLDLAPTTTNGQRLTSSTLLFRNFPRIILAGKSD